MTGDLEQRALSDAAAAPGATVLEEPASRSDAIRLRAGETLGLAGLLGSGTERRLARLFGIEPQREPVAVNGVPRRLASPAAAIAAGIGMVPAERALGLIIMPPCATTSCCRASTVSWAGGGSTLRRRTVSSAN